MLNLQFKSVFTQETDYQVPQKIISPQMPDITITTQGVLNLLRGIDVNKPAGPDNLSPRILNELSETLAEAITTIYQKSLEQERVPNDWLNARVVPTCKKKGERYDCENYRPISITCILCKVMEHIVASHIRKHLETNNTLYPLQHGFRSKRSSETIVGIYKRHHQKHGKRPADRYLYNRFFQSVR